MATYRWAIYNSKNSPLFVSVEPWANTFECPPGEELVFEAFDYDPATNGDHVLRVECTDDWVTLWAKDDACIRVLKSDLVLDEMTY